MIGSEEQLVTVDGLIDTLDVPQQDMRILHVYRIMHVQADEVMRKLTELEIIGSTPGAGGRTAKPGTSAAGTAQEAPPGEQPQVVLLQVTNSLLVNATTEQHEQIQTIINHVDVMAQDLRTFKVYKIEHAEASEVLKKLHELGFTNKIAPPAQTSRKTSITPGPAGAAPPQTPPAPTPASLITEDASAENVQVVVLDVVNSLLINATDEQHKRLTSIISYLDVEAQKERIPYEVYFLESQDPQKMADVLGKLVRETLTNKEGKVEAIIQKTDEEITIIPDAGTFSLIVYASRKNQDWISGLVKRLDKRRPQVLIDVTLVEIAKTEAFSYDLNLIQSVPNLNATSGLTGTLVPGQNAVTSADITSKLSASGRNRFIDYQSNSGDFTGFYGDRHIDLLLRTIESKSYGRVLAKPKILVNDNQPGTIKTADTTYVAKKSVIPISSAAGGNQATLVETAVDYQPYEAGITLNITPHISESDLLRLDILLSRSDFRDTADTEKPPDKTTSEVTTTVFVPDGSTIILGGLLRLNQNKGGSKVPLLGDIPLIGGLFRSISDKDAQSKLYVFVKAEIIRPDKVLARGMENLNTVSQKNREAFEEHESEFQNYQSWPGIESKPVDPEKVLDAQ
jgi:type II secretory pathway component GspD/PulD (secretin)